MDKYLIDGSRKLSGKVMVSGAKNAVLPILAATVLCDETVLYNVPDLSDVDAAVNILKGLGCSVIREGKTLKIKTYGIKPKAIPDSLSREMRSSIIFLGALTARFKNATLSYPGGCELGARPVDMHIDSLKKMGAKICEMHGRLNCSVDGELKGTEITLPFPSVGATENIILAATYAKGETIINNAAREPEIENLAKFLNNCGAKISFKHDMIHILGVKKLNNGCHQIIPDRIEAVTFMSAAAITGGEIELEHCVPAHLKAVISAFDEMGCEIYEEKDVVHFKAPPILKPVRIIKTMPYPGFPTDCQSPVMAALTKANGSSIFVENIFDSRYKHCMELRRLGANIETEGRVAVINGVKELYSATVKCTDLRGGAAVVIAALSASGQSTICNIHHIDRGYCNFEKKLNGIGASVKRILGD